jgi:hypothetical protein
LAGPGKPEFAAPWDAKGSHVSDRPEGEPASRIEKSAICKKVFVRVSQVYRALRQARCTPPFRPVRRRMTGAACRI